jgi:hypothetical protein
MTHRAGKNRPVMPKLTIGLLLIAFMFIVAIAGHIGEMRPATIHEPQGERE